MKNSIIKRSVSGVLTIAMVFSAYSCGNKDDKSSKSSKSDSQTAQTANNVIKNSYSSVDIDIDIPADYIDSVYYIKDTSQVLIMGVSNEENKLYLTDMDFSGFNEISLDFPKPANSQSYLRTTVSPDGYIYAVLTLIDYGDFKLPNYKDPNFDYENFDFDAMYEAAEYSCILYKLSPDGQVLSQNELANINDYSSDSIYEGIHINNIVADNKGNIILAMSGEEDMYLIADENGRINGKVSTGNDIHYINDFTTDTDGNIFACGYGNNGANVFTVDMNSKTFKTVETSSDDGQTDRNINDIYQGAGDYKLFFTTGNGLFGMTNDNKIEEIINWLDSDINSYSVRNIISLEDGDFIAYVEDYDNNDSAGFVRLTKRNAEELANQTVITVGMLYSDQAITSKITEFNKSSKDYRIKIADYSKYNEYNEEEQKMTNSAQKQLKMDIVSGNSPDMIVTYDYSLIAELAPQGTYADLSTYLEKDDDLSEDDIMPNVIKASTIKGKLYSLAPTFTVSTMACKSKFFGEENWTIDDLIDTIHDNKDMKIMRYGNTKDTAFSVLAASISDFVDFDKAECDFKNDDFKKILEFCNEFPDEADEIDWETASDEEMQKYWNEQDTLLMEDKALLDSITFSELTEYNTEKNAYFGGEDITLVGIPSTDGKGAGINMQNSFAILDSSPSKDACWEFIKEFFTMDYQASDNNIYMWGLPTLVDAFEKKAEAAMHKPYYLDDDGNKVEYDNSYYINNKEIKIEPLTKEEKDFIVDYIKKADKIFTDGAGDDINEIITTEVMKYFKGEATSQQACDMIQNRVSILLGEQA